MESAKVFMLLLRHILLMEDPLNLFALINHTLCKRFLLFGHLQLVDAFEYIRLTAGKQL